MKRAYLKKDYLLESAEVRKKELENFISLEKERLRNAPPGGLRITSNKSKPQYYYITEKGDKNGKYIPKSNLKFVKSLAQRDFEKKLLEMSEKQLALISSFIDEYTLLNPAAFFDGLKPYKKELVETVVLPSESFTKSWKAVKYNGRPFDSDAPELYSASGIRVRSKSEIIIADVLDKYKIPYRYEYPVKLNEYTAYPDFYCLNPNTGEELIWEHFGLMDNSEYVSQALNKMAEYAKKGFCPQRNLISTFENALLPFTSKMAERQVKLYFA